ncbi:GNAT family N-acetyltransferase [Paenibacillus radicis (ex Xue et al. 2023)]|uniref:GNAT family N-acetyltransferase n=1 Tax=Paenibacillus radicis (ex Xue et al. 2023) TaxID=2972489 RepID=A0ABT1YV19_9BACL|nr:GNAT family N-acetyltransferase [Paenibacillus radicis (ex Xue et al. 2023)]MCR8636797.1 GNAT family N-acetyltransferase [Paenibacillus radicis (ex Xue et al. 2023)]
MSVEIVPLNEPLVPYVKSLIAGYINSSSNGVNELDSTSKQLEECEEILNRFLQNSKSYCYVAKFDQDYVGFIVLSWSFSISKGHPVLRIDALYSSPKHRNTGVGRKLMQYAIDIAIENKASRLQLETDDDNAPARNLYNNLGFKLIPGKGVYMAFL